LNINERIEITQEALQCQLFNVFTHFKEFATENNNTTIGALIRSDLLIDGEHKMNDIIQASIIEDYNSLDSSNPLSTSEQYSKILKPFLGMRVSDVMLDGLNTIEYMQKQINKKSSNEIKEVFFGKENN
jgi:hypothetical protein